MLLLLLLHVEAKEERRSFVMEIPEAIHFTICQLSFRFEGKTFGFWRFWKLDGASESELLPFFKAKSDIFCIELVLVQVLSNFKYDSAYLNIS